MMKCISVILLASCFSVTALGQVTLTGTLKEDSSNGVRALPLTQMVVDGGGSTETDTKGKFRFKLPNKFKAGDIVHIRVMNKNGFIINDPLDGYWNLPDNTRNFASRDVILVPKGSKKLWTNARIEKHLSKLSDEIARLKKEGDMPRPIDFSFYLREWAEQYGFTPEQVKTAFDDWAKAVEKSDDYRTLGLRAFYQNNFPLAAANFVKAAEKDERQANRIGEQFDREKLSAYQNRKDAGNSLTNSYQFREALEQYNLARLRLTELILKDKHRYEQTEIEVLSGSAKRELGIRLEGAEGNRLLSEAVDLYKRAFAIFTREQLPYQWAMTQNDLGNALLRQSERVASEEGLKLLAEAISAFRNALLVYTREQLPQDWAMIQNNLCSALASQDQRMPDSGVVKRLAEAVSACHNALLVYIREQLPQQWAATQHNLGNVLSLQGKRMTGDEGMKILAEAVSAYRKALLVRTREELPQDWAATQNNLGNALSIQVERMQGSEGTKILAEAIVAYRNALLVYSREQLPQDWARTQYNLGLALSLQGARMAGDEGVKILAEAVSAYRKALLVRTREDLPQDWAMTQNNLCSALNSQGERMQGSEGMRLLAEAVSACHNALLVSTREQLPEQWATRQNNLGIALSSQGKRMTGDEGMKILAEAVSAYRKALLVRTREELPQDWAATQSNLGDAYNLLNEWGKAVECYANILTLYPNHENAYQRLSGIRHERLFEYELAFELHQKWLTSSPNDLSAMTNSAETHFTTERFAEGERRISALLANPKVEMNIGSGLRAIDVANSLALNKVDQVPAKLNAMIQAIANQPADFKLAWRFDGTLHFISQNEKLAIYRDWLLQLFGAAQAANRDAIVKGLREAKASFKW